MKPGHIVIAFLSCLFLFASSRPVLAEYDIVTVDGLVVGVAEGDRLTVNSYGNEIQVRLYGVAAPQIAKIDNFSGLYKPGQPYGDDAFRALSSKILHQQVKVEIRRTLVAKKDDPKQIALAVVYLDGRNINLEMIAEGWGWAYKKYLTRMDAAHYGAFERMAKSRKNGLWVQQNPQPPWCFKPQLLVRTRR
jgi:micrococcal nuclease